MDCARQSLPSLRQVELSCHGQNSIVNVVHPPNVGRPYMGTTVITAGSLQRHHTPSSYQRFRLPPCSACTKTPLTAIAGASGSETPAPVALGCIALARLRQHPFQSIVNVARTGEIVNFTPAMSPRPAGSLAATQSVPFQSTPWPIPPLRAYRYISGILDIGIKI